MNNTFTQLWGISTAPCVCADPSFFQNHMTYQEATEYLFNSTPLFQNVGKDAYKEGLENTLLLDKHFNHPHQQYQTIHIAGTNGKGSCSHTLAAILQEAGYKVGLYTSPHLVDFRERIRVNGACIPEERVVRFVEEERAFFEPLHPSFFEITTALAFLYFAEQKVDIAVIEVGLGGRLDCTNIISPLLSVITNISFDHVQFLGNTLDKIASEKAGIIKPNTPVIIGETTPETRPVFVEKALQCQAPVRFAEEEHELQTISEANDGTREYKTLHFGTINGVLNGDCQIKNTQTILAAVSELQKTLHISEQNIRDGFRNVCQTTGLRGRWQKLADSPKTYCDTGHNVGGISYIVKQLERIPCAQKRIVIGMVNDKDIAHVLEMLPKDAIYYFTQAKVKRALPAEALLAQAMEKGLDGKAFPSVIEAYTAARNEASSDDLIFIGGSTFIVADLFTDIFK